MQLERFTYAAFMSDHGKYILNSTEWPLVLKTLWRKHELRIQSRFFGRVRYSSLPLNNYYMDVNLNDYLFIQHIYLAFLFLFGSNGMTWAMNTSYSNHF